MTKNRKETISIINIFIYLNQKNMKKTILSVCGFCLAALMMTSCDGVFGEQGNPNPAADDVLDLRLEKVVPAHVWLKLMNTMPIYEGINPPIIEGAYRARPMDLVYDEYALAWPFMAPAQDLYMWFRGQNAYLNAVPVKNALKFKSKQGSIEMENDEVKIAGTGDNFTVYFTTTQQFTESTGNVIDVDLAVVISGTKVKNAIKDLYYGFVILGESASSIELLPEGATRVFKDGNTISPIDMDWTD